MALEIDKNKIRNTSEVTTVQTTAVTSSTSTTSQTPVIMEGHYYHPSTTTSTSQSTETEAEGIREERADANQKAVDEITQTKQQAAQAMVQRDNMLQATATRNDRIAQEIVQSTQQEQAQSEPVQKPAGKIEVLADKNKTIYQKTSELLDEYIKNHPEEYPDYASKSEKAKRAFRDSLMGKIFRTIKGKQNIDEQDRKTATRDLAILLTTLDASGKSLKDVQNNRAEMQSLIAQGEKDLYNYMLGQIDTKNPDKALNDIAELYLTFTDAEYLTKEGKAKADYMKTKQNNLLKMLGIKDTSKISPEAKQTSAEILLGLLKGLSDRGMTLKDYNDASAKVQSHMLLKSIDNMIAANPERFEKMPQDIKTGYKQLQIRDELIEKTGKDNPTERDLYNELIKLEKSGEITPEQKEMLDFYKGVDFMSHRNPRLKGILDGTAKTLPSTTIAAMVQGKTYEKLYEDRLKGLEPNSPEAQRVFGEIINEIANEPQSAAILSNALFGAMHKLGYNKEQFRAALGTIPAETRTKLTAYGHSASDATTVAEFSTAIAENGTNDMIETAQVCVEALPEFRSVEFVEKYTVELRTTVFDESISKGINNNYDIETANRIFTNAAQNRTTDEGKTSIVQQSLLTTDDSARIKAYTNSYKDIKNSVVTEAMASVAPQKSNAEIKNIINEAVNYSIQNNGYSQQEINNIKTANQTGTTSTQRNIASNTSSQVQTSRQTTKSQTSAKTQSSYTTNSSTSARTSGDTSEIDDLTAKKQKTINYTQEITSALQDKKDNTLRRIEQVIDNYQKSIQTQVVQQTSQSQKSDADTATKFIDQEEQTSNIPSKTIQELRTAYNTGGMAGLYEKLGSLSSNIQERFLTFFAKNAGSDSLRLFARSYAGNKDLIVALYQNSNDVSLLSYLDGASTMDLLAKGKIKMEDFLKYASPSTIAMYINELNKTGNKAQLKQIFSLLDNSKLKSANQNMAANQPGGDKWLEQLSHNMSSASKIPTMDDALQIGSAKVPMRGDYDKMKQRGPFYFSA